MCSNYQYVMKLAMCRPVAVLSSAIMFMRVNTFQLCPIAVTILHMTRKLILPVIVSCLLMGCASGVPLSEGTLDSPDPAARLYAIRRAGESRDQTQVPKLVELLDSSDPTERLLVIQSLELITGTRLDYDPYATPVQRQTAIQRWTDAVATNQFVASSQP
jgi:hypothetical protein